jgi:hypothetical protein
MQQQLILLAGLLRTDKSGLASEFFDVFHTWAEYLAEHGFDPANQLCTDEARWRSRIRSPK